MPSIRCWPTLSCAIPRHHLVAAIADDRLVGFISALDYWHPDKPRGLWINEVGVAPTWQHRGAGTRHLLMRQSRVMWLVEAMTNVVVGYALSVSVQPWCSRCSAWRRRCGRASASARSSPWSRSCAAICCGEFSRRCGSRRLASGSHAALNAIRTDRNPEPPPGGERPPSATPRSLPPGTPSLHPREASGRHRLVERRRCFFPPTMDCGPPGRKMPTTLG